MPITRTHSLRLIKILSATLIIILIASYALWRSLSYARGPQITILEPLDGSTISSSTAVIRGIVERTINISLNDKLISIDESGNFSETLIIFPGTNTITLKASDQFNRSVSTQLHLVGRSINTQ